MTQDSPNSISCGSESPDAPPHRNVDRALAEALLRAERSAAEAAQRVADLERRLAVSEKTLEHTARELASLLYSVSHDLRAPLRAVDGFSQALLDDYGAVIPEEGHRLLETVRRGSKRMAAMIDGLLTLSRLSTKPLEWLPVDMDSVVRTVFTELESAEGGCPAEVRVGEFPPCLGDPGLLKQVWINLLSNAFKFSKLRQPALIEVGGRAEGGEILYFVRDNGIGFDMRYVQKLFGVFQRLHRAEDFEGVGVGLAIVQRIIHRHGGRVWAESLENQQTTFFFTLTSQAS